MCGRYSLALTPAQIRAYLEAEGMDVDDAPPDDGSRQSFNFAPGYHGLVYRADVPDWGAGPRQHKKGQETAGEDEAVVEEHSASIDDQDVQETPKNKLQSMKWGLIPFWTKRNPDYASMLKTINCRSDSLLNSTGLWTTMKARKRCVVIAQGFYEWLHKKNHSSKDKIPHYIKRKDGKLLCMAGLWDCVQYEGSDEKLYTYTIITTDSNKQLSFLHDRMPAVLENGSEEMRVWLDPNRHVWTKELQGLLKPFEGELDIYPVSKEVGKVGNNSPTFIVPIDSEENKNNIANFFNNAKPSKSKGKSVEEVKQEVKNERNNKEDVIKEEDRETVDHNGTEDNAPLPVPKGSEKGPKREHIDDVLEDEPPTKTVKVEQSPTKPFKFEKSPSKTKEPSPSKPARKTRSATSNGTSPAKSASKDKGSQKITNFFSK